MILGGRPVRLGSPVVPFTLFFWFWVPLQSNQPKKRGALIIIWLLGYYTIGRASPETFRQSQFGPELKPSELYRHDTLESPLCSPGHRLLPKRIRLEGSLFGVCKGGTSRHRKTVHTSEPEARKSNHKSRGPASPAFSRHRCQMHVSNAIVRMSQVQREMTSAREHCSRQVQQVLGIMASRVLDPQRLSLPGWATRP